MNCHFCKTETPDGKIMFRDECERCGADLHICLNCSFHDPHASKQCREPAIPEEVRDKERKNLCEYFQSREAGQGQGDQSAGDDARRKLEELFK
jgi:hypothetical protein